MPCREWFEAQDASYRQQVLPPEVKARVSVEAAVALGWRDFVGDHGECVSIEHYGASAPYKILYEQFGSPLTGSWPQPTPACPRSARHLAQRPATEEHDMTDTLKALSDAGVAVWLDDLSRMRLATGSLATLIRDSHVVGVTTNPTIFQKAISGSDYYADQARDLAIRGVAVGEALRAMTAQDVRAACDLFRPAYDASDGVDGRVSIEVSPDLAHDTDRTNAEARALWWLVDRPNLFIKIPATQGRRAGDRGDPGPGHQRQRHADLLPRALRRGHRCVHERARARPGRRPRPVPARLGRLVLRLPRRHRGRRAAGQDRQRRSQCACAARPRSPTPGSPTSCSRRSSTPTAGGP